MPPDIYRQFAHDMLNITGRMQSVGSLLNENEPPAPEDIALVKKVLSQDSQKLADSLTLFCLLGLVNTDADAAQEVIDFALLAQEAAAPYLEDKNGPVVLNITTSSLDVKSDAELLRPVTEELIKNAVRHRAPQTAVDINLEEVNGNAVLTVTNTPEHSPPPTPETLFTRHRESSGLGIGLAFTKAAAERLNATLSHQHEGDFFTSTLILKC